jgi:enoyl-CoA hydratase/carnithine racemase
MGIVSHVFDDEELPNKTLELAQRIAGYTANGLRMTKEVMWANLDAPNLQASNVTTRAWSRGTTRAESRLVTTLFPR